jgi:peptide chain release factor 3
MSLERVLGIHALPLNWPLGSGREFRGVYDRETSEVHLFERTAGGAYQAPVEVAGAEDAAVLDAMAPDVYEQFKEEVGSAGRRRHGFRTRGRAKGQGDASLLWQRDE